jgi:hypothetical protein
MHNPAVLLAATLSSLRAGCWLLLAFHFFMRWLLMAIFR